MLTGFDWLALETKYLEPAREFYEGQLSLSPARVDGREVAYDVGDQQLVLRRPDGVPRGGLHTHYAFATPPGRYDDWWDRLSDSFDLVEHTFGSSRSLYCYDPDGNCVEIGQAGEGEAALSGIFEVVLEVESLTTAEPFYADIGFEPVDRGAERRRVRLAGPVDLELWEPHLGLADARGGVHVDVGFAAEDRAAVREAVADDAHAVVEEGDGLQVRDPDGHWLTFR